MAVVVYLKSLDIASQEAGPVILAKTLEKDRLIKGNLVLTGVVGVQEANYPSMRISRLSLPTHRIRYYVEGEEGKADVPQIDDIEASIDKEEPIAVIEKETPKKATRTRKRRAKKTTEVKDGEK